VPFDVLHVLSQWKYGFVSTEVVLRSLNPIKPTTQLFAFILQLHDTENLGMLPSHRFACRYTNKNMQRLGRVVIPICIREVLGPNPQAEEQKEKRAFVGELIF